MAIRCRLYRQIGNHNGKPLESMNKGVGVFKIMKNPKIENILSGSLSICFQLWKTVPVVDISFFLYPLGVMGWGDAGCRGCQGPLYRRGGTTRVSNRLENPIVLEVHVERRGLTLLARGKLLYSSNEPLIVVVRTVQEVYKNET